MRSAELFPLFADVTTLPGIGTQIKKILSHLLKGTRVVDLLFHIPVNIIDRRVMPALDKVQHGEMITQLVTPLEHAPPPMKTRRPYRVMCSNDSGYLEVLFFNAHKDYITKSLPIGKKVVVSGKVEVADHGLQMIHPDYIVPEVQLETVQRVEPVYPLTQGITNRKMVATINAALKTLKPLPEWVEENFLQKQDWADWKTSLEQLHAPQSLEDLDAHTKVRERLAYDELLANQLALALTRTSFKREGGVCMDGKGDLRKKIHSALPFKLTASQKEVLQEIAKDMKSDYRMLRLLQGDVGSGKTVVCLLAMLNAIECGKQAALMAPTEILSRQHFTWISNIVEEAGLQEKVKVVLLTGKGRAKQREELQAQIAGGEAQLVIGTHALFQEGVEFSNLGLVVIDEQHRFGVEQRLSLTSKGDKADMLLMTATPIPRTLSMTFYGDMDVSVLRDKPAGRKPVDTRTMSVARLQEVVEGLHRALADGQKVYWICPLVEESEKVDVAAAEERYDKFKAIFGEENVGLVHGRMKTAAKDKVMEAFAHGEIKILVATTVIEVGVDVPDATVMIIEHAERFGLAQLHQLRGRVGRGKKKSSCMLLFAEPLSDMARKRLQIMRETEDGFIIADQDLALRGTGELLGTRQSGLPDFRLANIIEHSELLLVARDDAKLVLHNDPELQSQRGKALQTLLHLFDYDTYTGYIYSG